MQEKKSRPNVVRRAETRAALTSAARTLFVEKGYAETSTPEIVRGAEVTRGALYHHFQDKADLFRAVAEAEAMAVADEIAANTSTEMAPLDAMIEGAAAYFRAMEAPGRARLLLVDGPAVLGLTELREIDRRTGGEELRQGIAFLAREHGLDLPDRELAELLSAAFDRASLAIAHGEDAEPYKQALTHLVKGLFPPAQSGSP